MREDRSRPRSQRAMVLVIAALSLGCACGPKMPTPRAPLRGPVLRVLTYNVNFALAGDHETIAAIRSASVDLALLQETNLAWERALRAALSTELPNMAFHNRGGAGGLAVLSRVPLGEIEFLKPTASGWFPAVRVVVETPIGRVQALGVHLHPPVTDAGSVIGGYFTTGGVRLEEIRAFFARLAPGLPTLVVGDFNEDSEGDVAKFLLTKGMVSAVAPDQPTWRWATGIGTIRKQFDHILYSRELDAVSAEVRVAGRSDHLPVIATLQIGRGTPDSE